MLSEAKEQIPEETARTCLALMKEGKLPHWAIDMLAPLNQTLELAAS